jgi:hypothetical protein
MNKKSNFNDSVLANHQTQKVSAIDNAYTFIDWQSYKKISNCPT